MAFLDVFGTCWTFTKDVVFIIVVLVATSMLLREGLAGLARGILLTLKKLVILDKLIQWYLRREVRGFLRQVDPKTFSKGKKKKVEIPKVGKH